MLKRILIVDDNQTFVKLLKDALLSKNDYIVETAVNGEEGLQKALANKPDLILLDILMPKMQGDEVLKRLRADSSFDTTEIYVLTQVADEKKIMEAVALKIRGYILKSEQSIADIVGMIESVFPPSE